MNTRSDHTTAGAGVGVALGLISALGFAAGPIFAILLYRLGFDWAPLLAWRFLIAAGLAWLVAVVVPVYRRDLATLPPTEVLRAQTLGAVVGPLNMIVGLFTAPLRDLIGVVDARIRQLEERGEGAPAPEPEAAAPEPETAPPEAPEAPAEPEAAASTEAGPAEPDQEPESADTQEQEA